MKCTRCGRRTDIERTCAWCGWEFALCSEDLERTFICGTCFETQKALGKEEARELAKDRERQLRKLRLQRRLAGYRREESRRLRAAYRRSQLLLWPMPSRPSRIRPGLVHRTLAVPDRA